MSYISILHGAQISSGKDQSADAVFAFAFTRCADTLKTADLTEFQAIRRHDPRSMVITCPANTRDASVKGAQGQQETSSTVLEELVTGEFYIKTIAVLIPFQRPFFKLLVLSIVLL